MESASFVVDLINSVALLTETLPQLLKKVSEWNLLQKDIPETIDNFRTDLKYIQNCLATLKSHISDLDNHFGEHFNFKKLGIDTDHCSDKLKQLETQLNNIHMRTQKKCMCFPSTRVIRLDDLRERQTTLIGDIQTLIESFNSLKMEYDYMQSAYIQMAPLPESNLILNFEDQSPEKNIFHEILREESSLNAIKAVARGEAPTLLGPGGVGKTQTICYIAHRYEVRKRFPGGIFFIRLGAEGSAQELISRIAHMTARVGSESEAENIRDLRSIEAAVEQASETFKNRCCLVIFDDLWSVNGIPLNIVEMLIQLVRHPDGKVVFTTRDAKLYGGKQIFFGHRTDNESEAILLAHSGLQKPDSEIHLQSFNNIIKLCNGLPVALALAGKSVRSLAARRDSEDQSLAWLDYKIDWEDEHVTAMNKVLLKAIDVMSIDGIDYSKYFKYLCVIQKAEQIPVSILSRVWSVSEKNAEKLVDSLFRFSIIRIGAENCGGERVRTIGLHDLILDICREQARSSKTFFSAHFTLIASYKPGDKSLPQCGKASGKPKNILSENVDAAVQMMDSFRNWWLSVSDDSYIHRHIVRLLQVCERPDDVIWLLNKPKWIVLQFERNGVQMVRSDISFAINAVQHSSLSDNRKAVMVRWFKTVSTALTGSLVQIQLANWRGMIWTQLYGRLQNFAPKDICVDTFLSEIENQAPRPWLKPNEKLFHLPSKNLQESFMLNGKYLCHTEITGGIMFLTISGDQLYLFVFKYGSDQSSRQAIMKVQGNDFFKLGLFNKEGSETFVSTCDGRLIYMKRNFHAKVSQDAYWNNVTHIAKVQSILSDWSAFNFDFGDNHGPMQSFDLSETGTTLVICFTRNIGVYSFVHGNWEKHFLYWYSDLDNSVFNCAVNGDGSVIISFYSSKEAYVWSTATSKWTHDSISCVKIGFDTCSSGIFFKRLSKDGNQIVAFGIGRDVGVFEKTINSSSKYYWEQKHVGKHYYDICTVGVRGDGNQFVCLLNDGSVHLWTYSNFEWKDRFIGRHCESSTHKTYAAAFLERQNKILSVNDSNVVCVWDIKEHSRVEHIRVPVKEYLRYTSKYGKRFVLLLSNRNQQTKFMRVVDKMEGRSGRWVKEDIELSNDVFKLLLVEEEEQIVSMGEKEQFLLWRSGVGGWNAETLRVERINLQTLTTNVARLFLCRTDTEIFFLSKWDCSWKVQAIAAPKASVTSDTLKDGNIINGLFNNKSSRWNGYRIGKVEHDRSNLAVSPCGNLVLVPCVNVIYSMQHCGEHWKDEILEGHRGLIYTVDMNSDGTRVVSRSFDNDGEQVLVWKKSEHKWESEQVIVTYSCSNEQHAHILSIERGLTGVPSNVQIANSDWFLLSRCNAGIYMYRRQSNGQWTESIVSEYLAINFPQIVYSKWYQAEQLDENINRAIRVILNERSFFRLSDRVLLASTRWRDFEAALDVVTI